MVMNENKIFGSFLPNVYVDKITLKDSKIEVDFHIKEASLGNDKYSVSSFDFFKKYVLIKIEVVTEREEFEKAKKEKNFNIGKPIKIYELLEIISSNKKDKKFEKNEYHFTSIIKLEKNYSDLGLIVYSDLNYRDLSRNLNFSIDSTKFKIFKTYEDVVSNNKAVELSEKYILANGSEWYGEVVGNDNIGFYTDENPRRYLQKVQYKNTKIQDFRDSTLKTNIPSLNDSIVRNNSLTISSDLRVNTTFTKNLLNSFSSRQEVISDYYDIIDDNNYVSFVFSLNFKNLIEQQTSFAYNFINPNNINKIIQKTQINSCRLYRTQKTDPKANNSSAILSSKKELVSDIYQPYNLTNSEVKKMFLIKDLTSNSVKAGIYEYSLELDITNGITEYLAEKIDILYKDQKNLISYNNLSVYPQYYNKTTNFFKLPETTKLYEDLKIEQGIINFITILAELNNSYTSDDVSKILNNFKTYTDPKTATIQSIQYVLDLHKDLLKNLFNYSGVKIESNGDFTYQYPSKGSLIKIDKIFKELIDLNRDYEVRLNFVDTPDNNISYTEVESSFSRMLQQYGLMNASNTVKERLYSCLPPKTIKINGSTIPIFNNIPRTFRGEKEYLNSLFIEINLSIDKKPEYIIPSTLFRSDREQRTNIINLLNFSKILQEHGVVIEADLLRPQVSDNLSLGNIEYYLNNISLYNCSNGLTKTFYYDEKYVSDIKNEFDSSPDLASSMPVLTFRGIDQTNSMGIPDALFTTGKYIILYRIIYDLEFLDIKTTDNQEEFVWKPLTQTLFNNFIQNRRSLLFRLKQNSSPTTYDTSKMKTAKHFIVNFT